jgi:hypothetical protein
MHAVRTTIVITTMNNVCILVLAAQRSTHRVARSTKTNLSKDQQRLRCCSQQIKVVSNAVAHEPIHKLELQEPVPKLRRMTAVQL